MTDELASTIVGADDACPTGPMVPDVYFTPGYGTAAAIAEGGTWQLAHHQDQVLIPYVLRQIDHDSVDAVSPYGYSGVYAHPGCTAADLARIWASTVARWREIGLVTLFLRFSPLDPGAVEAARSLPGLELTRRADTITVNVGRGPNQIWDGMESTCRNKIRKARNAGLEGAIRPAGPEDIATGSAFRGLYEQTMLRVSSSPGYLFPDAYYQRLAHGLGKSLFIAEVRDPDGLVVAASLVLRHQDRAHYHLAGSAPEALRQGANNLLLWTILHWAAEAGCAVVHLGGGVRPDDGLFTFKRSLGGARTAFWTGSAVLRPDLYQVLLAAHASRLGQSIEHVRNTGFFPGYRLERN